MKGDLKGTMLRYNKRYLRIHRVFLKEYGTLCGSSNLPFSPLFPSLEKRGKGMKIKRVCHPELVSGSLMICIQK
jgi:hypothetical protein